MPASDIKALKIQSLKWRVQKRKLTIELTQYKAGQPVSLSLVADIGNALSPTAKHEMHPLHHSHASMLIEIGFAPLEIADRLNQFRRAAPAKENL